MIDINILRTDPEVVKASLKKRHVNADKLQIVDQVIELDKEYRNKQVKFDELRAEQKEIGKQVAQAQGDEKGKIIAKVKSLADDVKAAENSLSETKSEYEALLKKIPNVIESDTPEANVILKTVGTPKQFDKNEMLTHDAIGEELGIIDTVRGAKTSGSRFYFLKGLGAQLEQALLRYAFETAVAEGFCPMVTPVLVLPETMAGMGFLDEHADEVYKLGTDELYLTGTSEVALGGYHSNEIIQFGQQTEKRYAGVSTCFRREAGSYGKDTKGIFRVHQFNKIEMFSYTTVANAPAEHQKFLEIEEKMLSSLELPYQVVDIAADDLGSSAARKFDCEAWIPSMNSYREMTSTSNCTDFQGRRLSIRHKSAESGKNEVVATVNGTLATTRWLVAILENYYTKQDGLKIPKVLEKYIIK